MMSEIVCHSQPEIRRGQLPRNRSDFEIVCDDKLIGLAIWRDDGYDVYLFTSGGVVHVNQKVDEKKILATVNSVVRSPIRPIF